jgi:hypothetical protein
MSFPFFFTVSSFRPQKKTENTISHRLSICRVAKSPFGHNNENHGR